MLMFKLQIKLRINTVKIFRSTFVKKTWRCYFPIINFYSALTNIKQGAWYYQRLGSLMGGIEGAAVVPRWRGVVEWKGVQSISRKSVCTARSPNAATLSSYSFDRDPLSLCTQSLMTLFKDRNRSMSRDAARVCEEGRARPVKIINLFSIIDQCFICRKQEYNEQILCNPEIFGSSSKHQIILHSYNT